MALSVATNVGALSAATAASSVNRSMETSMARLSSGSRINSAADDAAGLSIATRLESEARGLDMAYKNAADAQSLVDTADSASIEIGNLLQRMRELAVQGASDTNSTADRTNIKAEIDALISEMDTITADTKWAGNTLIDDANTFVLQIGNEASETITLTTTDSDATALSVALAGTSQANFDAFITLANTGIASIATSRAKLGALSNRLDYAMQHFANTSASIKSSLGRIQDTDYAAETTNLAKTQILQQAATSMLAQANASKQSVLQLLQG
jgi:flagellin